MPLPVCYRLPPRGVRLPRGRPSPPYAPPPPPPPPPPALPLTLGIRGPPGRWFPGRRARGPLRGFPLAGARPSAHSPPPRPPRPPSPLRRFGRPGPSGLAPSWACGRHTVTPARASAARLRPPPPPARVLFGWRFPCLAPVRRRLFAFVAYSSCRFAFTLLAPRVPGPPRVSPPVWVAVRFALCSALLRSAPVGPVRGRRVFSICVRVPHAFIRCIDCFFAGCPAPRGPPWCMRPRGFIVFVSFWLAWRGRAACGPPPPPCSLFLAAMLASVSAGPIAFACFRFFLVRRLLWRVRLALSRSAASCRPVCVAGCPPFSPRVAWWALRLAAGSGLLLTPGSSVVGARASSCRWPLTSSLAGVGVPPARLHCPLFVVRPLSPAPDRLSASSAGVSPSPVREHIFRHSSIFG